MRSFKEMEDQIRKDGMDPNQLKERVGRIHDALENLNFDLFKAEVDSMLEYLPDAEYRFGFMQSTRQMLIAKAIAADVTKHIKEKLGDISDDESDLPEELQATLKNLRAQGHNVIVHKLECE